MEAVDLTVRLEELFHEVGEAHHRADGTDPEWPLWYADYLRDRVDPLLDVGFTSSELVYLLIRVANEQPLGLRGPAGQDTMPSFSSGYTHKSLAEWL